MVVYSPVNFTTPFLIMSYPGTLGRHRLKGQKSQNDSPSVGSEVVGISVLPSVVEGVL